MIEECLDIRVEDPVDPAFLDPDRQRVQRIVLAASGPEPVAEPQELLLVDRGEEVDPRLLDDLVLQRGDAERPLPAIGLWYVLPPRRLRPVRSRVDPPAQSLQIAR